ncbi:MAG: hemerythrin domain-containing protein [Planctomycetes bacterium]|nr:hemerythrin domain-containing protein [Planctomycetota bacterium]
MSDATGKRHPGLVSFSREHHHGLVQARRLLAAAGGEPPERRAALRSFRDAWEDTIASHFADEEALLLPLVESEELRKRLQTDHEALRKMAAACAASSDSSDPDGDLLASLGEALRSHIQWEERVLFSAIEKTAGEAVLASLAGRR